MSREIRGTLYRTLRCKLNDLEQLEKGKRLGEKNAELRDLKAHHKAEKAAMKAAEDELDAECLQLQVDVLEGAEARSVECTVFHDYGKGKVETVRSDTFEVIESRPMVETERQLQMGGMPPAPLPIPRPTRRKPGITGIAELTDPDPDEGGGGSDA